MIRLFRRVGLVLIVVALEASFVSPAAAAPPEHVATAGPNYSELATDGVRIWALRQGSSVTARLMVDDGEIVAGEEFFLPAGCLRFAAAPDGVLYVVTAEDHGMTGHVWRKIGAGAWESGPTFAAGGAYEVAGAEMIFVGDRLVISVWLREFFDDGQSGNFGNGRLLLVDRVTHAFTTLEQNVRGIVRDGSVLYGTRHTPVPGGMAIAGVKSSDGGSNWVELADARPLLNLPFAPLLLGGPQAVGAGRFFSFDPLSRAVVVGREGDAPMAYPVPGDSDMDYRAMQIAREGESCVGIFEEAPLAPSDWGRGLVVVSHRFLRDFETHEIGGLGHLDALALDDAFYLLRDAVGGSALYRITLPGERVSLAETPQLGIATAERVFTDPLLASPVVRSTLELTLPTAAGAFYQIQTSTDMLEWAPVGLPAPGGSVETILVDPEVPRRFFK